MYSDTISMVLYHGLRVHDLSGRVHWDLFLCIERQYTEQFTDNQVNQFSAILAELKHYVGTSDTAHQSGKNQNL